VIKPRTKLLVSVRNAQEAIMALEAGVDLIDVKEPTRGSLGAADGQIIGEVLNVVAGRRPVSAALGELEQCSSSIASLPAGLRYGKVGLAGCAQDRQWPERWGAIIETLRRSSTQPVAVVYADWETAGSPSPGEVLQCAQEFLVGTVLVDTFDKSLPGLTKLWTMTRICSLVEAAHAGKMEMVLAGKISMNDAAGLKQIGADYVAVRSAVCQPDRNGTLDGGLLRQLLELLN
jgi:uncharacterized protein (UPF0264 family)